jgi:hypothetical protein
VLRIAASRPTDLTTASASILKDSSQNILLATDSAPWNLLILRKHLRHDPPFGY